MPYNPSSPNPISPHSEQLLACVSCVCHTTGDSPSGGSRPRRMSFQGRHKAHPDTPNECGAGRSRLSEKPRCAGETQCLRAALSGSMGIASPAEPVPVLRPLIMVCVHHDNGGSHAIMFVVISVFWQLIDCDTLRSAPGPAEQLAGYLGRFAVDLAGRHHCLGAG